MKTARTALILAGVTIGLLTTAGTGTALAASPVSIGAPTAVSAPLENDGHGDGKGGDRGRNDGGRDHGWKGGNDHDWKGGNDHWRGGHDRDWNNNNRWHWDRHDNHNRNWNWGWYTVSPSKCRNGGGHVDHHQCDGGRYDGRWVR